MEVSSFEPIDSPDFKTEFILLLEEMILNGTLGAGDRLPAERELACRYGVSRPTIHECILVLENRGLVTLRPRHGVVVNNFRKQATLEVLLTLLEGDGHELGPGLHKDLEHFRIHMEKDVVRLICRGKAAAASDMNHLDSINAEMAAARDAAELAELDFDFHLELALLSGNTIYPLLANTLKPAHTEYLTRFYRNPGNRDKAVSFHRDLVNSLSAGNEDEAVKLIERLDSYSAYL